MLLHIHRDALKETAEPDPLNGGNTFSGEWFVDNAELQVDVVGALGKGSSVLVGDALAIFDPLVAITDTTASLTITNGVMNLNNGIEHVYAFGLVTLLGNVVPAGTFTAAELNTIAGGTVAVDNGGTLSVVFVPEPTTLGLMGLTREITEATNSLTIELTWDGGRPFVENY